MTAAALSSLTTGRAASLSMRRIDDVCVDVQRRRDARMAELFLGDLDLIGYEH